MYCMKKLLKIYKTATCFLIANLVIVTKFTMSTLVINTHVHNEMTRFYNSMMLKHKNITAFNQENIKTGNEITVNKIDTLITKGKKRKEKGNEQFNDQDEKEKKNWALVKSKKEQTLL